MTHQIHTTTRITPWDDREFVTAYERAREAVHHEDLGDGPAAAAEVERRLREDDRQSGLLRDWAVGRQLVTPVSGAVVLERAIQYEAAGLKQIDPMSAPAIPEPSNYGLWLMLVVLLFVVGRRPRVRRASAGVGADGE